MRESFGFGTAPMVALGCKYLRICHLNTCATGVATQNDELRKQHFIGPPEKVENFFRFVAEDVRGLLAQLGVRRLDEIVGRTDLLRQREGVTAKQRKARSCAAAWLAVSSTAAPACAAAPIPDSGLALRIAADTRTALENASGGEFHYAIANTDRAIGARLSGDVARRHGDHGMAATPIMLQLEGAAGQSLGAWNAGGVHIVLDGEANDGVGKGMAGGRIVVRPPQGAAFAGASNRRSSATPVCTAPPVASCSRRVAPASASPCAIPARWRWSKARAITAANT